jgi:hypothetical protein
MSTFLNLEMNSYEISLETAQFDFYLTWTGLLIGALIVAGLRARKVIKTKKTK